MWLNGRVTCYVILSVADPPWAEKRSRPRVAKALTESKDLSLTKNNYDSIDSFLTFTFRRLEKS